MGVKQFLFKFPRTNNWIFFHVYDTSSFNVIYLNKIFSFDIESTVKIVNFLEKSSNSIDLQIIYNRRVIFKFVF